jgi:hypothetical protein
MRRLAYGLILVLAREFPDDGKPKEIASPEPDTHVEVRDHVRVVDPITLIELASGMSARNRLQDLADVQRLIEAHRLDAAYAERLHPSVRAKFLDLAAADD